MKLHIFMTGIQAGTLDIEKKIPYVIKTYPNAEIKRTTPFAPVFDIACIEAKNIASNLKIAKILEREVDLNVDIDCYGFSNCSYTLFDISFNLDRELIEPFFKETDYGYTLMKGTSIKIDGKIRDFLVLITEYLAPYFNLEKLMGLSERDDENMSLNEKIEEIKKDFSVTPHMINGPYMNTSIGPYNTYFIIEDYKNEVEVSNQKMKSITKDDAIYIDEDRLLYICKKESYYQNLWDYHLIHNMHSNLLMHSKEFCETFLDRIKNKATNIRANIDEDNNNSHYWKKLKKTIEIMDLNFLEFHVRAIQFCEDNKIERVTTKFTLTDTHKDKIKKRHNKEAKRLKGILNEVKYSIKNLSTPSHSHDEGILQKETEKVNDRILMLSFIAMAVSAIGMMRSNDISILFKAISGLGIFSLPIIYYLARNFQQKISKKRNERQELNKKITDNEKRLESMNSDIKDIEESKEYPEDFKKELLSIRQHFIKQTEKTLDSLKKKKK